MSLRFEAGSVCSVIGVFALTAIISVAPAQADQLFIGFSYSDAAVVSWFDTEGSATTPTWLVSGQYGYLRDISIDPVGRRMHWVCDTNTSFYSNMYSARLDGTDLATTSVTGDVFSLTVDEVSGGVYYGGLFKEGATYPREVRRRNLDGTNPQTVMDTAPDMAYSVDIAHQAGKMYWTEGWYNLYRSDLDGSNVEPVLSWAGGIYDIAVDEAHGMVYWGGFNEIVRAPLDGSSPPEVIHTGNEAKTLALSPDGSTVYFGDDNSPSGIYRLNANGSGFAFVTAVYNPTALDVLPEPNTLLLLGMGGLIVLGGRRTIG